MCDLLKLDANEGRPDPLPAASAAFLDVEAARRYPDGRPLEAAIAESLGVAKERVVVSAGGDDIIERYARILLRSGSAALGTEPSFESYAAAAARAGGMYLSVPREPEGPFPAEELIRAARCLRPAFIAIASPDNPGGGVIGAAELKAVAELGIPILFDAVYSHFADDQDIYRSAFELESCTMLGSFSKAYGLAGLRVGWAVTSPDMARRIKAAGPPYPVATTSLAAAMAAFRDGGPSLGRRVDRVRRERKLLVALLSELGARTWQGQGNFATARVPDATVLARALAERGVAVRHWPELPERKGLVRITCPCDERDYDRLASALRECKEYL